MVIANPPELCTRRKLDFVNRIQMIPSMAWSSNGSMFVPCQSSVMFAPGDLEAIKHLPLPFGNSRIHPRSFLRDWREVEPARTFNAKGELPEMDLRLKRRKDHGIVARFAVSIDLDIVEQEH